MRSSERLMRKSGDEVAALRQKLSTFEASREVRTGKEGKRRCEEKRGNKTESED